MSEIKYGLISEVDKNCLEKTIDLICNEFDEGFIYSIKVTEIGLFDCGTANGISEYIMSKGHSVDYIGIDNEKDKPINAPYFLRYIKGNSNEVYNQLEDNSQHLIFQDACHCFSCCVSSFFCYADKVKVGGFMAWHDAGKHILPFKDFQHGDKNNPDAYISARKALEKMGLLDNDNPEWRIIFDDADSANPAGGIVVIKKVPYIK